MQSTAYGSTRIGATIVPECDKAWKPLKFTMIMLLILTILTLLLIISGAVYNHYKLVNAAEKPEDITFKKKLINIGTYGSIFTSFMSVAAVLYAIPNVNKVISCPAVQ